MEEVCKWGKEFSARSGCLTGDCPHDHANECLEAVNEYGEEFEKAALAALEEKP